MLPSHLIVRTRLVTLLLCLCAVALLPAGATAQTASMSADKPIVRAAHTLDEELFQTLIVMHALQDLGFRVKSQRRGQYPQVHRWVADGEVTFIANHWAPLHRLLLGQSPDRRLAPLGRLINRATQGYLIDRRTAAQYNLRSLDQLQSRQIASLFDQDGDGKADLIGCEPSWSCASVVNRHLSALGLSGTVTHHQDDYNQAVGRAAIRLRREQPILMYAWTPYWVTSRFDVKSQVQWLQVPATDNSNGLSGAPVPGPGGFIENSIHVVGNPAFLKAQPQAAALFRQIRIPPEDVSNQNQLMQIGENSVPDIERHARRWIADNQARYDQWLQAARNATP